MTSPFIGFDNAILTFSVSDGTFTINSVGNRTPGSKTEIIKAVLKEVQNRSTVSRYADEIQQFAGADGRARLMEGYLVSPTTYPPNIKFLAEADAEITVILGRTETGRFKLLPVTQSPYVVALGVDLIEPIIGIFRSN
jgi:hypothetical protein